jgi:hypothetical protein
MPNTQQSSSGRQESRGQKHGSDKDRRNRAPISFTTVREGKARPERGFSTTDKEA